MSAQDVFPGGHVVYNKYDVYPVGHVVHGEMAYPFLDKVLGGHVAETSNNVDDLQFDHAWDMIRHLPDGKRPVFLKLDASLGSPEAFRIRTEESPPRIDGGGSAGLLYGVQQWLSQPQIPASPSVERPDFGLRGATLYLMKDETYEWQLTPKEFPWFYDRPLLTRYLDHLLANRFNTIFLWTGHLFPSLVSMPEYPDATDLTPAQLARNQEQFRWFTRECARRNISVLLHSYQIILPKVLADSRKIGVQYNKPNEFTTKYVRYALERFLAAFDSVGLYVCPGEASNQSIRPPGSAT